MNSSSCRMRNTRVLSVFPKFPVSFWSYKYAIEMLGKKATMPPTGLATVAGMLPRDKFDLDRIIDMNVEPLTDKQIDSADLVFASAMIVQKPSLEEVIERVHSRGKKIVVGGPYATSYSEQISADHLVLGEAELTLPPFVNDFFEGKARRIYDENSVDKNNILLTKNGKPIITNTNIPRWDLLDLKNYYSMAVQYSRGCPFDCDFCDITKLFGKESRTKTPEQMVREFDALYTAGWKGPVFIVDDNFIGNASNVREFLPVLQEWQEDHKYPFSFLTEASMNLGNRNYKDILHGMVKAGFDHVFLGIESPDQDVIKKMNKGQNLGDPLERIKNIQEAGLEVTGGFIIGADGEKDGASERLFNFIQEAGIVVPMPGLLTALKGTELYKRLDREGRIRHETSGNNTHNLGFNFIPERDEETLIRDYTNLLEKLFDSKNYFERCRTLNERRGEFHKLPVKFPSDIRAFGNIIYEKIIKHPDGYFARYLFEIALKSPSKIPLVIAQGVKLHHFQTMTEATLDVARYTEHTQTLYETFKQKVGNLKKTINLEEISSTKKEIMADARRKYARIHEDFRDRARQAYKNLLRNVSI